MKISSTLLSIAYNCLLTSNNKVSLRKALMLALQVCSSYYSLVGRSRNAIVNTRVRALENTTQSNWNQ